MASPHDSESGEVARLGAENAALQRELAELRADNAALRSLGAAASRTARARNDEREAIRALLGLSTTRMGAAADVVERANRDAQKLREWHATRRLVIHPPRGTTAIVCTVNPLTLVSDTTQTLMIHSAAAGGNVAVLRALIVDVGFQPDTRDTVRPTATAHRGVPTNHLLPADSVAGTAH